VVCDIDGTLAPIVKNRERAMMRRQVRVLTSEGRLSAWVLALLPIGIATYLFIANPDYVGLLVTTRMGITMLVGAIVLLGVGMALFAIAVIGARGQYGRSPRAFEDGLGRVRVLIVRARIGLAVMRRPIPAATAA